MYSSHRHACACVAAVQASRKGLLIVQAEARLMSFRIPLMSPFLDLNNRLSALTDTGSLIILPLTMSCTCSLV